MVVGAIVGANDGERADEFIEVHVGALLGDCA